MAACVLVMVEKSVFRQDLLSVLDSIPGVQVLSVSSVDEMLAQSAQQIPDLLLLDLDVAGMSDLSPVVSLAERSELIMTRFWVLTGPAATESTLSIVACYADRVLFKPVAPSQLAEEIVAEISPPGSGLRWLGE